MSIYINGIDMPKKGEFKHLRIYDNGEVTIEQSGVEYPIGKAEQAKHGKWNMAWHSFFKEDLPVCSCCGRFSPFKCINFCPNCGADMRGEP